MAALIAADPPPQLLTPPTPVSRRVSASNRGGVQVASYDASADPLKQDAPLYRERSVVPAPEYDDEHPDELSYRPFPIAPFLTVTASADDPALSGMVHPNLAKIIETLDQDNVAPPMRLRPGLHAAERMWAQQFKGEAVDLSSFLDANATRAAALPNRKVATQPQ